MRTELEAAEGRYRTLGYVSQTCIKKRIGDLWVREFKTVISIGINMISSAIWCYKHK